MFVMKKIENSGMAFSLSKVKRLVLNESVEIIIELLFAYRLAMYAPDC